MGEASDLSLEDLAIGVEERMEEEIRKRLGRRAQYASVITITRSRDGRIDLGVDLQVFSPVPLEDKVFLGIIDEVIDAGFGEAEKRIKRSRERAVGDLEDKKSGSSLTPISRS